MKIKKVVTKSGLKIYLKGNHVKTVSIRYIGVIDSCFDKISLSKKRLNNDDRELLDMALFFEDYRIWLQYLKITERYLYKMIKSLDIDHVRVVVTHHGDRYEIVYTNNVKVRCNLALYRLYPIKKGLVYSNY